MTTKLSIKIIYSVIFKFFLKSNKIELIYFEIDFFLFCGMLLLDGGRAGQKLHRRLTSQLLSIRPRRIEIGIAGKCGLGVRQTIMH
jgi:hypothetical protein